EKKRPGDLVRVLFAECTTADAGYDAERLNAEFAGSIEAEGTLLDELPDRLDRYHYDLVATTTFHADEAQALVGGRAPVVAMLVGPGYVEFDPAGLELLRRAIGHAATARARNPRPAREALAAARA